MSPAEHDTPDERALAVVAEITEASFELLHAWPVEDRDPRTHRLALLVDVHGLFTPLSVLLGYAASELQHRAADEPAGVDPRASYRVLYRAPVRSRDVAGVVERLLGYVVAGTPDALAKLHEAAALLRSAGAESARVLIGVLDLCLALREDRVALVRQHHPREQRAAGEGT